MRKGGGGGGQWADGLTFEWLYVGMLWDMAES